MRVSSRSKLPVLVIAALLCACSGAEQRLPVSNASGSAGPTGTPTSRADPTNATPSAQVEDPISPALEAPPVAMTSVSELSLEGRVLFTQGVNGLWELDLASGNLQQLVQTSAGGWVNGVAIEPGTGRLALAYSKTATPLFHNDLAIAQSDGSDIVILQERIVDYEYFGTPVFHPNNGWLYYTHMWSQVSEDGQFTDIHLAIERTRPQADSSPELVVPDAMLPSFSNDGEWMAYIHSGETGFDRSIRLSRVDGSGAREVIPARDFSLLFGSQISPDGETILFAGSGENLALQQDRSVFDRLLGVQAAYAHGLPWEIWSVDVASGDLRRLTDLYLDSPWPTWSPDGSQLLILSSSGLVLLGQEGQVYELASADGHGEAVWVADGEVGQ